MFDWNSLLRGSIGLVALLLICFIFSNNRKGIDWKLVITGMIIQLIFGILILKVPFVTMIFQFLSDAFVKLINLSHKGTEFIFGKLANPTGTWSYVFAIQVLPNIIFFAAMSSILYYLGILQKIVYVFALILSKLRISGPESMSTAANIFLGQTEAPLMIRPFLDRMNKSEMLCIMVGGMANTAGSVLAAYVGFLGGNDPVQQKYFALHMLTQSIMSAPAAIVCSKILFPQDKNIELEKELNIPKEKLGDNLLDAISLGTTDGLKLAVNVGAMLIVFTALVEVLNYTLFKVGDWTHVNGVIATFSGGRYPGLTFTMLLGYLFAPIAWLIGISSNEMLQVGQLLGEKTVINEFQAYITFGGMKASGMISEPKSILITTYALCGFANFASIGIQIGGISQLAPNQRNNLTTLGLKALLGGTIACLMVACIAGILKG
ncbi:MAG TPA: nucleoside transporter C-terminal domain-containing protein [Saprospiraceae bacterium]|nr:nucleoside transporter C-terminal domain-containing protein [Saprospiraceae bacterium]HQW57022.1 nucleoside transporter C-terminal domain-containing protein [Saprospiraceae bacterium]